MHNPIRRRATTILIILILSLALPTSVFAHPLGNFTINHYAGLDVTKDAITIDYIIDMAEIPAFQEIASFDTNGNGQPDAMENNLYHAAKCQSLQSELDLRANNRSVGLSLTSSNVDFPPGAGGLPTLRLTCNFSAPLTNQITNISFSDNAYADRLGWREIVVTGDEVGLQGDFASTSLSQRLTAYPEDMLSSPLDQREISFTVDMMAASQSMQPSNQPATSLQPAREDAFTRLITLENLTLPTILLALAISFVWGAAHALTPGHGKTIVGAYLVGSRGTIKHALYLGLTTTITHTLGVFALGLITLFASQYILPERLYPWMSLLSGLFVVGIGLNLFIQRFRTSGIPEWASKLKANLPVLQPAYSPALQATESEHTEHAHAHHLVISPTHNSSHSYIRGAAHSHSHGPDHDHVHPHDHHHREHHHGDHEHTHEHDGHHHANDEHHQHAHPHAHTHDHDHHHHHAHDHGPGGHSHTPPEEITWRSLLALGVSGGLIPCPSALVVMLGAIALNRIGFGLILVLAFSLGLAGALTAIGMLFIYAGRLFERFPAQARVLQFLPVLSAVFVAAIGVGISVKALAEIGLI